MNFRYFSGHFAKNHPGAEIKTTHKSSAHLFMNLRKCLVGENENKLSKHDEHNMLEYFCKRIGISYKQYNLQTHGTQIVEH